MKIDEKFLRVTMPDGSKWDVPVRKIAEHRAWDFVRCPLHRPGERPEAVTFEKAYKECVIPLFESDPSQIMGWASMMRWKDVVAFARKVIDHPMIDADFQEGWINGDKEIVEESK